MNIVVTIPKKLIKNFYQELEEMELDSDLRKFIKIPHVPSMADIGDAVFIVLDGQVRYKAVICGFDAIDFKCATTLKDWTGNFVICNRFEKFNGPSVTGFQGFRYAWWEKGEQ